MMTSVRVFKDHCEINYPRCEGISWFMDAQCEVLYRCMRDDILT